MEAKDEKVSGQVMAKETDEEWKIVEKEKKKTQGKTIAQQENLRTKIRRDKGPEDDDDNESE